MACLVLLDLGLCKTLCDDAKSLVYVCWQFWMYANLVAWILSNLLVMLCVDDELLCLYLLCEFISSVNSVRHNSIHFYH